MGGRETAPRGSRPVSREQKIPTSLTHGCLPEVRRWDPRLGDGVGPLLLLRALQAPLTQTAPRKTGTRSEETGHPGLQALVASELLQKTQKSKREGREGEM